MDKRTFVCQLTIQEAQSSGFRTIRAGLDFFAYEVSEDKIAEAETAISQLLSDFASKLNETLSKLSDAGQPEANDVG